MRPENYINKSEFQRMLKMIHESGMSKSKFAMKAGINPTYFLRVLNRGKMSRKQYDKVIRSL